MKKKELLSIFVVSFVIIILYLIPSFISEAANEPPFTDVKKGDVVSNVAHLYYPQNDMDTDELYNAIKTLYNNNLMFGQTETRFGVSDYHMRYDWVTVLWRMSGSPHKGTNYFYEVYPDIEYDLKFDESGKFIGHENHFTIPAVWAAKNGIMSGYVSTGEFGTSDGIVRKDAIASCYRYYKKICKMTDEQMQEMEINRVPNYTDLQEIQSEGRESAVRWAIGVGILDDSQGGKFNSAEVIKRDEGAILLSRLLDLTE